jgi:hypothetical protein
MDAKELMVGDWVRIKDNVDEEAYFMHEGMKAGQYIKVEEVLSIGINPRWNGAEVSDMIPWDAIEPVPITVEILMDNDFEDVFHAYSDWAYKYEIKDEKGWDIADVSICYGLEAEEWTCEFFGKNGESNEFRCKHVHELQHAMRLLGIDKEIVLQ